MKVSTSTKRYHRCPASPEKWINVLIRLALDNKFHTFIKYTKCYIYFDTQSMRCLVRVFLKISSSTYTTRHNFFEQILCMYFYNFSFFSFGLSVLASSPLPWYCFLFWRYFWKILTDAYQDRVSLTKIKCQPKSLSTGPSVVPILS